MDFTSKSITKMIFASVILIFAIADQFNCQVVLDPTLNEDYQKWRSQYNKPPTGDSPARRKIWEDNYRSIEKHNEEADGGLHTYTQGLNEYSDLTFEEFAKEKLGLRLPNVLPRSSNYKLSGLKNPDFVDWRNAGIVTPVRNQQTCGSCWAFTAAHAVEAYYTKATNKSKVFSPQQMVDCDRSSNQGCNGGWMTDAFTYLKQTGLQEESTYPYANTQNQCNFDRTKAVANITGHVVVTQGTGNEVALTDALANHGPVAIALYVSSGFQNYKSGVFFDTTYKSQFVNHAVLAVGYGVLNGEEYYLIKNTWGTSWGQNGYIYLARNRNNHLGVASYASFPIVAGDVNTSLNPTTLPPSPLPTTSSQDSSSRGGSNTITSTILTQTELNSLVILSGIRLNQRLSLAYRGSRDGFSPKDFHELCDGLTNTLTLVRTTNNFVFGGYTSVSWSSEYSYKSDPSAFLFSLRRSGVSQAVRLNIRDSRYAIGCSPEFGPIFGGGFDFMVQNRVGSAGGLGFTYQLPRGLTYMSLQAQTYLAGTAQYQISDVEVYQIIS